MVTSKVLNPERLKKIKGNREKLASRLTFDHFQVPSQLLFTKSLSVHSEHLTALQYTSSLKLIPVSGGVSTWKDDLENITLRNRSVGPKIVL